MSLPFDKLHHGSSEIRDESKLCLFFTERCTLEMKMHHSCSDESGVNQLSRSCSEHSDSSRRSVPHLHSECNEHTSSLWCCILEATAPADFNVSFPWSDIIAVQIKSWIPDLLFDRELCRTHSAPHPTLSEDSLLESYRWASGNLDSLLISLLEESWIAFISQSLPVFPSLFLLKSAAIFYVSFLEI